MHKRGANGNNMAEIRKGYDRGRCTLYWGEENAKNILLKCPEKKKWRDKFLCSK
jgi:hypothetical protein